MNQTNTAADQGAARAASTGGQHSIFINTSPKTIRSEHIRLGGEDPAGRRIDATNYYLRREGRPWFGISGEFHYSRCDERFWDRELGKVKSGGIGVVATYLFWNHHEEIQGTFDWSGRRDLRRFLELCGKHGLLAIIRIGPFDHGEVRNGGFPDWLYGQPFELRSNDEGYLVLVRRWYAQIAAQVRGLLWKDGGPVIGTQIENEYQHSAAPWEMTTGISNEWLPGGRDGDAHLLALKAMARELGIETPLYTCTAWGGAATPPGELLPLWGGYSFQPWIFYDPRITEHPATPEYIFRDYHNNAIPRTYNFEPKYQPEDYPYACCEMGGGMTVFYKYRFRLPPAAVSAMALIKLAGGSNFLGYYMYHGGTNPRGKRTFLNEHAVPKFSYDYQAVLGEWGQARRHFHDLRLIHYFLDQFGEAFCSTKTGLPPGAEAISPTDPHALRWAVRSDGTGGFLFIVNYQDHFPLAAKEGVSFQLDFGGEGKGPAEPAATGPAGPAPALRSAVAGIATAQPASAEMATPLAATAGLRIPAAGGLDIAPELCAILPFNQDLDGLRLRYATAQPVCRLETGGEPWWFFLAPAGLRSEFALVAGEVASVIGSPHDLDRIANPEGSGNDTLLVVRPQGVSGGHWRVVLANGRTCNLALVPEAEARQLYLVELAGQRHLVRSDALVYATTDSRGRPALAVEHDAATRPALAAFPALPAGCNLDGRFLKPETPASDELFTSYLAAGVAACADGRLDLPVTMVGERKARVRLPKAMPEGLDDLILVVDYEGDIGNAYIGGQLVHDHFWNGESWEISLACLGNGLPDDSWSQELCLDIIPVRAGSQVVSDTTMAGRLEKNQGESGRIKGIATRGVRTSWLRLAD